VSPADPNGGASREVRPPARHSAPRPIRVLLVDDHRLIPESLAYATIAGVPPVVGLYAAVPALVLYAVIGSSRPLVVSPKRAD